MDFIKGKIKYFTWLLFVIGSGLFAVENTDSTQAALLKTLQTDPMPASDFGSELLRVILSLAVVLGLVYLAMHGLQRFMRRNTFRESGTMQLVGTLPLGAKKQIMIVRVEDRRLLVGVTDHAINLLCELDSETPDAFREAELKEEKTGFQQILKQWTQKRGHGCEDE